MIDSGTYRVCQVCWDVAVGFHCGARVCEACKKFFIRCLKLKCGEKFRCTSLGCCPINKTSRTKCPSCRYKKCLQLNMYGPGSQNVSKEINHMPCKVCGAPSSGFHFGAITCEGCKGFFRRCLWDKNIASYRCIEAGSEEGRCEVTWQTRNTCKFCRYKRCLNIGMKSNKSRIGRQSNFVKHNIHMALNEIKMAKGLPVNNIFPLFGSSTSETPGNLGLSATCTDTCESGILRAQSGATTSNAENPPLTFDHSDGDSSAASDNSTYCTLDVDSSTLINFPSPSILSSASPSSSSSSPPLSISSQLSIPHHSSFESPSPSERITSNKSIIKYNNSNNNSNNNSIISFTTNQMIRYDSIAADKSPTSIDILFPRDFHSKMSKLTSLSSVPHQSSCLLRNPPCTLGNIFDLMSSLYKYLEPIPGKFEVAEIGSTATLESVWDYEMSHLVRCTELISQFAKNVPGFSSMSLTEQVVSTQKCIFPIANFLFSVVPDKENGTRSWFGFSEKEHQKLLKMFEPFKHFLPHFYELVDFVKKISIDEVEISFICALYLMDVGNRYEYKEFLLDCLETYIKMKCGPKSERHMLVFRCLKELNQTADLYHHVNKLIFTNPKYQRLTKPQAITEHQFTEMFS